MPKKHRAAHRAQARDLLDRLQKKPELYGRDPDLWPVLIWRFGEAERFKQLALIALALRKDGPVTFDIHVVVRSPKRAVTQVKDGDSFVAILTDAQKGTPRRVDHGLGVNLFRGALTELQRLRSKLKGTAGSNRRWTDAWEKLKERFPVAHEVESCGLVDEMRAAVIDQSNALDPIAATIVHRRKPAVLPKPTTIIRSAGLKSFSRRRRSS
jgi:hypothetical protein